MDISPPEAPPRDLTRAEIDAFHTDGVVRLSGMIDDRWLGRIAEGVEYLLANPTVLAQATALLGGGGFAGDAFMWKTHDGFRDFMFFSPAARIAQQLFGSTAITAFYDQIFAKPAGSGAPTPFHEDVSSWPIAGEQVCAMWIPLDPCTPDTAALQVVRGSHRWGRRYVPITPGATHLGRREELEAVPDVSDHEILSWDLTPGDIVLFHPAALHGATGTGPERQRRAFVSRWVGDGVTFQPQHAVLPLLWEHGLRPGDPIGGPLFPRVLPTPVPTETGARFDGPQQPHAERAEEFLTILRML
ncbi:phytanoyl-CoA dioxygenase family protein [Micromonospora sp. DSM 115977]|uniref:Phytanoyl-CoA dioxygenase family protein n=1 Tax=Micromonospora reichwaldensis TaxID=3075516 RepID=A0ABU2X3Q4_9ACTN|nr:phytanoyl-CoA dioxygenase family protein [Micromonospora sp. DSM 115977]MDT0532829.1 phytanoyl-CoA dioxygenase family protein [Micromonospora sp. DSM 115977]